MGTKRKNIVNFVSSQPKLEDWIRDFGLHLKTSPKQNRMTYPESFASGYADVFRIEEGCTFRMVDYQLNCDFRFTRSPSKDFYLILYFYEYKNCKELQLRINRRIIVNNVEADYSTLLMTNSQLAQELTVTRETQVRGLTIQLTEEWLKEKIANPDKFNFDMFREQDVFQSFIKPKSQKLLKEIFEKSDHSAIPELYRNTRVLRLTEIFLDRILKNGLKALVLPSSSQEVENIRKVENYLVTHYNEQFPHIEMLSRLACMSPTKLKTVFKKAFGQSLFKYYQKNRMHKGKEFLKSGEYSVSQVGKMLGYHNISNFSLAFKKEFREYPHNAQKIA